MTYEYANPRDHTLNRNEVYCKYECRLSQPTLSCRDNRRMASMLGKEAVDDMSVHGSQGKNQTQEIRKHFSNLVIPAGRLDKTTITQSQNCGV